MTSFVVWEFRESFAKIVVSVANMNDERSTILAVLIPDNASSDKFSVLQIVLSAFYRQCTLTDLSIAARRFTSWPEPPYVYDARPGLAKVCLSGSSSPAQQC